MNHPKDLAEYLFLDEPRIERYFQQISAPVRYDKLPVWKVALGLTGPSVEGTQSRPAREFSLNEKIEEVVRHMESEDLIDHITLGRTDDKPFQSQTLSARRARIERADKALNIWVSIRGHEEIMGAVYLIEDFRGRDESARLFSAYSSLWLLADELKWVAAPIADPIQQLKQQEKKMRRFASDPIGSLKSIGAEFGPERRIHAIYRFRAACVDETNESLTTIGYPLIIREA